MASKRKEFEKWASAAPREWILKRHPKDAKKSSWPGQYVQYHVQCAWEAWKERECGSIPSPPMPPPIRVIKEGCDLPSKLSARHV